PAQKRQLDEDGTAGHLGPSLLDKPAARLKSSTGGQQVVHQQHALAGQEAVDVDLQLGAAVFQVVLQGVSAVGQLAGLAQGHERLWQHQGQGGGEQEAAGLGGGDGVDVLVPVVPSQYVNGRLESVRIGQERRNVLELNPRPGKIGDGTDVFAEVHRAPFLGPDSGETYRVERGRATMALVIRPAGPADAVVVADFNRRLALETEGKTLDGQVLACGVAAGLADPRKALYFVAEEAGSVRGQMMVTTEW